jgi:hypothetical protein
MHETVLLCHLHTELEDVTAGQDGLTFFPDF